MSTTATAPATATMPTKPARTLSGWILLAMIFAVAALGIAYGTSDAVKDTALKTAAAWLGHLFPEGPSATDNDAPQASASSEGPVGADASSGPWDGSVTFSPTQQKAIGVRTVAVLAQTEPLKLELQGKTDYNPDTLVKIRPRFDALVLAVHATVGQRVKKGDSLVDLYSVRLAEAKLEYESKQSQAEHDRQIAMHQRDLVAQGVIPDSSRVLLDAINLERRSLLEFKLARDTLLTVASIEELWVWGSVYERDLANVRQGLEWEVHFPFTRESVAGTVEYVSNQVDPQTHAVRIRGSIPNADGHFKSDQLVRVIVKCPPQTGNTVIPRRAVVTNAGDCFVFVQRPAAPDTFERRSVEIEHEFSDHVIVASGLTPGEVVVTTGSLVMTQVYEDRLAVETGEAM